MDENQRDELEMRRRFTIRHYSPFVRKLDAAAMVVSVMNDLEDLPVADPEIGSRNPW